MTDVGVDQVLAVDTKLPQFLVRGSTPLSQHEVVMNTVCLIEWRQISVMFFKRLQPPQTNYTKETEAD